MGRRRGHRDTQHVSLDTTHADKERAGCCLTALALLRCHWSLQAELPQLMVRTSSGIGRHDRDVQVCGALGVRAEVEAAMLLKYRQGSGYTVQDAAHERASGPSYS